MSLKQTHPCHIHSKPPGTDMATQEEIDAFVDSLNPFSERTRRELIAKLADDRYQYDIADDINDGLTDDEK